MNGRGGCCIARYGDGGIYGMSKVDRIMLKFRPIAPKPAAGGSTTENSDGYVKCEKIKRKYVRVNKTKRSNGQKRRVTTLSLLPETPDRKNNSPVSGFSDLLSPVQTTTCNSNNSDEKSAPEPDPVVMKPAPTTLPGRPELVSYVTVECVTDTCMDLEGLGCTDEERVKNMEKDTCPGFISDDQDRVVWANEAYRQMAGAGHVYGGGDIAVVLVRKDKRTPTPFNYYPVFTCKVRVSSAVQSRRPTPSSYSPTLTLPCDVWKMERGGCAWRLDVKAALSLGR